MAVLRLHTEHTQSRNCLFQSPKKSNKRKSEQYMKQFLDVVVCSGFLGIVRAKINLGVPIILPSRLIVTLIVMCSVVAEMEPIGFPKIHTS